MPKLSVRSLTKSYADKVILDQASFTLKTGEILGVFGRNGSGKSTMLKILFGTLKAHSGEVLIDDKGYGPKLKSFQKNKIVEEQLIGYLPQFSFLPQSAKVWDIIPLYFDDGKKQDLIFNAPRFAKLTQKRVFELSLGERRYLEVLLVGNLDHPFLMLDEPFSMVEPLYKEVIQSFLLSLKAKKGILITDHYYHDVWEISDHKQVLKEGKLLPVKSFDDLKALGYLKK